MPRLEFEVIATDVFLFPLAGHLVAEGAEDDFAEKFHDGARNGADEDLLHGPAEEHVAYRNGKNHVIDELCDHRRNVGTSGERLEVLAPCEFSHAVVYDGVDERRGEHGECRAQHHVPGTAKRGVEGVVGDLGRIGVRIDVAVEFSPHSRRMGKDVEEQAGAQVHEEGDHRDLHGGLGPESLAYHVHAQEREPAERKATVKSHVFKRDQFLVREQVHAHDGEDKETDGEGGNVAQQDNQVLPFTLDIVFHFVF